MRNNTGLALILAITLLAKFLPAQTQVQPELDKMGGTFLFNSKDASFITFKYQMPTCWGSEVPIRLYGWQKKGDTLIYLIDQKFYLLPTETDSITNVNFESFVKSNYLKEDEKEEDTFARMDAIANGEITLHSLAIAAWCHQQGNEALASKLIQKWKKQSTISADSAILLWRSELAWGAYAGMVHHYMMRKDDIAVRHAIQIEELYPEAYTEHTQTRAIINEINDRFARGKINTSGKDSLPTNYVNWALEKKADFLIGQLDEVDQRQWGQPGGVPLGEDWRVKQLILLGDSVVPFLIDVIEKDRRFTRSVHFWRDFARNRTVLNVKEVALTAIMSIWQDPLFRPASTGDNFTSRGEAQAKQLAIQLREQQRKYKGKSLDVRKIEVLKDPTKSNHDHKQAASDLANFGRERVYGTTVWSDRLTGKKDWKNPLIEKYSNPTLAEMIWETMQSDLIDFRNGEDYAQKDWELESFEERYLFVLVDLGDQRITSKLIDAYKNTNDVGTQRRLAYTAYWLGDNSLWKDYCDRLVNGKITLPEIVYSNGSISYSNPAVYDGNRELSGILYYLQKIDDELSTKTKQTITSPGHPYYKWIDLRLQQLCGGYDHDGNISETWYDPDFCIDIYWKNLDNTKESDIIYKYYDGSGISTIMDWGGSSSLRLHEMWDYSDFATEGEDLELRARVCDAVSTKLYHLIYGIPVSHVHMKDKDARIKRQKDFLEKFGDQLRSLTGDEYNTINQLYLGTRFVPEMPRLDHPATLQEVADGNAIFSMPGNTIADIQLPAWGIRAIDEKEEHPMTAYIVQAERTIEGELLYGVFTEDGPKIYKEEELINIVSYKTTSK